MEQVRYFVSKNKWLRTDWGQWSALPFVPLSRAGVDKFNPQTTAWHLLHWKYWSRLLSNLIYFSVLQADPSSLLLSCDLHWSVFFPFPGCHFNSSYWRCWHACSYYCPEQLFWMGFVCWGLPTEQQLADHCWCPHWLLWGHPLLHHVCGKKSAEILLVFEVMKNFIQYIC